MLLQYIKLLYPHTLFYYSIIYYKPFQLVIMLEKPKILYSECIREIYSLADTGFLASLSLSRNSLLKIFPLGLFGIVSINSTPPPSHLNRGLCSSTCLQMARAIPSSGCSPHLSDLTIYAFGTSPVRSFGTWITAQSETYGWERR
jgi:hypothetical protein